MAAFTWHAPVRSWVSARCSRCNKYDEWHAVSKYNGRDKSMTIKTAHRWALEEGWTNPKRGQWLCPQCSHKQQEGATA